MILTENWEQHEEYGYRHRHYIQALSCGPMVYLRTLKCGSTFFYNNLVDWGWEEINFCDIKWQTQIVFSHIMEPVRRRHKAIAEYIFMTNTWDLLFDNPKIQQFIQRVPLLDSHSVSYHDYYGQLSWLIDWIPLSTDHEENTALTERLLNYGAGTATFKWNADHAHPGHAIKKQIENKLIELWGQDQTEPKEYVDFYLERDQLLYQTVTQQFDKDGGTWPKTSWLRNRLRYQ